MVVVDCDGISDDGVMVDVDEEDGGVIASGAEERLAVAAVRVACSAARCCTLGEYLAKGEDCGAVGPELACAATGPANPLAAAPITNRQTRNIFMILTPTRLFYQKAAPHTSIGPRSGCGTRARG